jgi:hypothetical protein
MNLSIRSLCLVFVLTAAASALPARAVTVSVVPADTTVESGESFSVCITTDACRDLKWFEFVFSFDPAKLRLLGVEPGDVRAGSGNQFVAYLVPDAAPPETVWYAAAMLAGSASGPGTLACFVFAGLAEGESPVQCERVDFRDSDNVQTLPDCVSDVVRITGPTPAQPASWGRIKTLYR